MAVVVGLVRCTYSVHHTQGHRNAAEAVCCGDCNAGMYETVLRSECHRLVM